MVVEGYMLYHSLVYFGDNLPQVVDDINVIILWDVNSTNNFRNVIFVIPTI